MRFRKGNRIWYGHDMQFYRGIPAGIDFSVEPSSDGGFRLEAEGYGCLTKRNAYSAGGLYVSRLTARQRRRFEAACDPEVLAEAKKDQAEVFNAAIADLKARAKRLGVKVIIMKPGEEKEDGERLHQPEGLPATSEAVEETPNAS